MLYNWDISNYKILLTMNVSDQSLTALKNEIQQEAKNIDLKKKEIQKKEIIVAEQDREYAKVKSDLATMKTELQQMEQHQRQTHAELESMQRQLAQAIKPK